VTPGVGTGSQRLVDDAQGTGNLDEICIDTRTLADRRGDLLVPVFGPGAFIFIDAVTSRSLLGLATSNTSGVGGYGPSGASPGESSECGAYGSCGLGVNLPYLQPRHDR